MKSGKIFLSGIACLTLMNIGAGPATQPADGVDAPVPMAVLPEEYSVLRDRNVFGTPKNHGGAQAASGPESGFVLKGVVQAGGGFTAFIEELASKQVKQVVAGDAIVRGKIKTIDLETVEYEASGSSRKIEVGQDFNGQTPPPPPPPPPAVPAGQPAGPVPAGAPGQAGPVQMHRGHSMNGMNGNEQPAPPQDGPPNQDGVPGQ
jgi:hypothetical protein